MEDAFSCIPWIILGLGTLYMFVLGCIGTWFEEDNK